ncbi:hypothetical protein EC991_003051 [Linnemannia zychae]|nr:hypothetical protein EC991_003051 [Linnemannia zychae]
MTNEIPYQSLRYPSSDKTVEVQAHYNLETRQYVLLWDDIVKLFPRVRYLIDGKVIVSGARNASLHLLEPRCVKYYADKVLDVVEREE